ncbi:MAG TPA: hypothetical protein VNM92_14710 [Thermoanaerobaculia bacterium]|nr:hypothetical protein [Thermoanaerobaculia bacterium]
MSQVAQIKAAKVVVAFHSSYGVMALLGFNTLALIALEQMHGIPSWIKSAAAIFLAL